MAGPADAKHGSPSPFARNVEDAGDRAVLDLLAAAGVSADAVDRLLRAWAASAPDAVPLHRGTFMDWLKAVGLLSNTGAKAVALWMKGYIDQAQAMQLVAGGIESELARRPDLAVASEPPPSPGALLANGDAPLPSFTPAAYAPAKPSSPPKLDPDAARKAALQTTLQEGAPPAPPAPVPAAPAAPPAVVPSVAVPKTVVVQPPIADPDDPYIGSMLGKCRIVEQIGVGGYGVVYRAVHATLSLDVAVKILRSASDAGLAEFQSEARLLARLNHPNVVRVLDFDTTADGLPYIVMELVDGCSLQQLISSGGPVRYDRLLPIVRETAMALQAGEEMGLVHCDVKPANILVNRRGNVKLTDYGLALAQGAKQGPSGGTVGFMSPEQFNGGDVDGLSDLFSLGVTFYYAVTGKLAFPSQTWMQYARILLGPPPAAPHVVRPEVPKSVSDLIMEMLEREKSRRIPSFDDLFDRLDQAAAQAVAPSSGKPRTSGAPSLWNRLMGGTPHP